MDIVSAELDRLREVQEAIERTRVYRAAKVVAHDGHTAELEKERLDSVSWREKNDLTEKLKEHSFHDPRKYLPAFDNVNSPYFGVVGISDTDEKIGDKVYLIGKQSLIDTNNKTVIVHWCQAAVSRFFYDYSQGEEYLEEVQGVEREGVITRRDTVTIFQGQLRRIETPADTYELVGDTWQKNGQAHTSTADHKLQEKDHRLPEIIALIDPDQFRLITKGHAGVTLITGPGGSGKTTVMCHQLVYLIFNNPDRYRSDRSMLVVFNTNLRNNLQLTAKELLKDVKVETFSSWALGALGALGVHSFKTTFSDPYCEAKKKTAISELLAHYVKSTEWAEPIMDLWRFYALPQVQEALIPLKERRGFSAAVSRCLTNKTRVLTFSDVAILLRLCQLRRSPDATVREALNYYDHVGLDEGQDMCLVELEALRAATSRQCSMTICADDKQKILSFVDATGFATFKTQLHSLGLDRDNLTISYRCGRAIMEFASRIIDRPLAPTKNEDGELRFHPVRNRSDANEKVREIVGRTLATHPNALVAVLCRRKTDMKSAHAALSGMTGLRAPGVMSFEPGVVIASPWQVKGLEFTAVVMYDPADADYRDTPEDTHLLYVQASRASKKLDLVYWRPLAKALRTAMGDLEPCPDCCCLADNCTCSKLSAAS